MDLLVSEVGRAYTQLVDARCDMEFPWFVSPSTSERKTQIQKYIYFQKFQVCVYFTSVVLRLVYLLFITKESVMVNFKFSHV